MTRIKDATFESNSVTGTDAMSSNSGATLNSASLIKGTYCLRTQWATAVNVNASITGLGSNSELYTSFYVRVAQIQTSGTPRLVTASNGSTQWVIDMSTAGAMRIRNNGTNLATILTPTLNTTYRIGVYLKPSSAAAAADGILRVWVATGDAAFSGTPTYENTAYTMNASNANITSIAFGQNNASGNLGDYYWDDIRVDNASMPGPSVVVTHSVKSGSWRWYSDSASDAGLTALAAENTAPTLSSANYMQGLAVLRLRVQLSEQSGGAGSGTVQVQYGGDTSTFQDLGDNPLSNTQAGYLAAWGAGGATHLGTITTRLLTGSNESGTYRESSSATAESVGASAVHELDVAIILRYPPPNTTLYFRIAYDGNAIDAVTSLPSLTTASIAIRGSTVDKLASQASGFAAGELFRPQYNRIIWDGANFWAFVPDPAGTTTLKYYYWDGQAANAWSAASSITFTGPITAGRMWITYKLVGTRKVIYAMYYRAGDMYLRRGTISGTTITWQSEDVFDNFNLTGTQVAGAHHGVIDLGDKFTFAALDSSLGVIAARSATADDGSASTYFLSMNGLTPASVADPDGAPTGTYAIQVVPINSTDSLIVWSNLSNLKAVKYNGASNTFGSVQTINSAHATDFYAVKQGSYVYIFFNTGVSNATVMYAYSISGNTYAACPSPSMTIVSGDGVALVPGATDEVFLIANFTGALGGTDREIKYKKYTGPGSGGSYGSLTSIASSASRGKGRHIVGQQAAATNARAVVLWEFGEDLIISTPFSLEFHGINLFNAFNQIVAVATTPARSLSKSAVAIRKYSLTSARSARKTVAKTLARSVASTRSIARNTSKTIKRTVAPVLSPRKAVSKPLAKSVTVTASLSRARLMILQATATASATQRRIITHITLATVVTLLVIARAIQAIRAAVASASLTMIRSVKIFMRFVTALATESPVTSILRIITIRRGAQVTTATSPRKIVAIARRTISAGLTRSSKLASIVRSRAILANASPRKFVTKLVQGGSIVASSARKHAIVGRRATVAISRSRSIAVAKAIRYAATISFSRFRSVVIFRRATASSSRSIPRAILATRRLVATVNPYRILRTVKPLLAQASRSASMSRQALKFAILRARVSAIPSLRRYFVKNIHYGAAPVIRIRKEISRSVIAVISVIGFRSTVVIKRLKAVITSVTSYKRLTVITRRATAVISADPVKIVQKRLTLIATSAGHIYKRAWAIRRAQVARSAAQRKTVSKRLRIYTISSPRVVKGLTQIVATVATSAGAIRRAVAKRLGIAQAQVLASRQLRSAKALRAFALPLPRRIFKGVLHRSGIVTATATGSISKSVRKTIEILTSVSIVPAIRRAIAKIVTGQVEVAPRITKIARITRGAIVTSGARLQKSIARILQKGIVIAPQAQRLVTLVKIAIAIAITSPYKKITKLLSRSVNPLLSSSRAIVKLLRWRAQPIVRNTKQIAKQPLRAQVQRLARIVFALPSGLGRSLGNGALAIDRATRKLSSGINRAVRSLRRDT